VSEGKSVSNQKWSSKLLFIITAIGAEAGVASVWKFSYLAGVNGGGLFVLTYFAALVVIAIPALIAEMMIGRRGGGSMIGSMIALRDKDGISPLWKGLGILSFLCLLLTISYYFIVCGWMVDYLVQAVQGRFAGLDAAGAASQLDDMMGSPRRMLGYSALLITLTSLIVTNGLNAGVERISGILTPLRFAIMAALMVYACVTGDGYRAAKFLFTIDTTHFNYAAIAAAIGQAFFSLGIGVGVMLTVGAYTPSDYPLGRSAIMVSGAQMLIALMSGLTIFAVVFGNGLQPAQGPGLLFVALPLAFGQMPMGYAVGIAMFLLMSLAAVTATSVMVEAIVFVLTERAGWRRAPVVWLVGLGLWLAGAVTALSFSTWAQVHPLTWFGFASTKNPFELLDYLTSTIMMPLGGLLVAVLAGWSLPKAALASDLGLPPNSARIILLRFALRFVVPITVLVLAVGMI
jgi:NSS family neurotransmitter:Na+ symporter